VQDLFPNMRTSVHCSSYATHSDICLAAETNDLKSLAVGAKVCPLLTMGSGDRKPHHPTPKLMVCHDMKGNYLNDRWNNGAYFENAFQLLHWSHIDVFCYFSHEFVTIPPKAWVNVCHRNDTPILGTIITEWDAGYDACSDVFGSAKSALEFAHKIAALTKCLDLDGWLVNIENGLSVSTGHVEHLLLFLRTLTAALHEISPNCSVIW
jgi:mannosyl-glycoprotein endo-beta-N-acetylglucosaminidase